MPRTLPLIRYASDDGTTGGTKNANGDYSGAAEEFYVEAAAGETLRFDRLMIWYEDAAGGTMQEYGNLNVALANGIEMEIRDNDGVVVRDLTDGVPITSNGQWCRLVGPDTDRKDWGQGNDGFIARWSWNKFSSGITLEPGWRFVVKLNDNFDGLVEHYFVLQGEL